jgi:hypothetical protein
MGVVIMVRKISKKIVDKVSGYSLGLEILVYGFDQFCRSHLIDIADPGVAIEHDSPEHWAVGSGFHMAMASLNASMPAPNERTEATFVYRACEAKFAAKFADGVGDPISVMIWYPEGRFSILSDSDIQKIREISQRNRHLPIPKKTKQLIEKTLVD